MASLPIFCSSAEPESKGRPSMMPRSARAARAWRTGFVTLTSRSLSILGTLITVPLVLNHLGPERYGLWATLSVVFVYLKLADGGATIGLIALVSRADGTGDVNRIRALISTAFVLTCILAVLSPLGAIIAHSIDWHRALNLTDPGMASEAAAATAVIIIATGLGLPASVARFARLGLQQGAAANSWDLAASVGTFCGQLTTIYLGCGIVALASVTALTPIVVNAAASVTFFTGEGRRWRPRARLANGPILVALFASGSMFLGLMLTQALSVQMEPVLIARLLGLEAVASYTVVQKLFAQPQSLVAIFLIAQFPAYGEALTRGDHDWIIAHFRQTLVLTMALAVLLCGVLALTAQPLLRVWIGASIKPTSELIACLAIYGIVATIANVFTYFFFALGLYRRVIFAYAAMIAINIPLALLLIPRIGPEGAALATSCGYLVALIVPSAFSLRAVLEDLPRLRTKALGGATSPAEAQADAAA